MESLEKKYQVVLQTLKTFHESLETIKNPKFEELHDELRDSVIKRFEYSMDTFWKYLKDYLAVENKVTAAISSPKSVFRECLNVKIITDEQFETLLDMVDDRNLTSHTYNEILAQEISEHAKKYYQIMYDIMKHCGASR